MGFDEYKDELDVVEEFDELAIPGVEMKALTADHVYVVKYGESISQIGAKLGVVWQALAAKNGITAPYKVNPGDELRY